MKTMKDAIDWWKNGTTTIEKVLFIVLILSILCMCTGIIAGLFVNNH